MTKGEADSRLGDFFTFGKAVEPMGLNFTGHGEEAAVLEFSGDALFCHGVLKVKATNCSETHTCYGGIFDNGGLVVAMP